MALSERLAALLAYIAGDGSYAKGHRPELAPDFECDRGLGPETAEDFVLGRECGGELLELTVLGHCEDADTAAVFFEARDEITGLTMRFSLLAKWRAHALLRVLYLYAHMPNLRVEKLTR